MANGSEPVWLQAITSVGSDAVSELERENAHFEVAEAIVCALEQLCSKDDSDSDEEDTDHIRDYAHSLTAPEINMTPNSSPISPAIVRKSVSKPRTDRQNSNELSDWVSVVDTDTPSITALSDNSISSVLEKFAENQSSDKNSARFIAKQLFDRINFSSEESAELDWLVTERGRRHAPSISRTVSDLSLPTRLRGTSDWAPPRAQIIYHMHLPATRKSILSRCGYRCAGCGMKIDNAMASWFRYCAYLGKYFCHSCHHEKTAHIPARILHKWDFRKQRVSNFASDLLEKMYFEPLYCIQDINYNLYKTVSEMKYARALRYQLFFLKEYIRTCRNGKDLLDNMTLRTHIINEPQLFSLEDLCAVKDRTLIEEMKFLVTSWLQHVDNCGLCKGKGFICELCARDEVIYPFQLDSAVQCQMCWTCFHKACYSGTCPKCARIRSRRTMSEPDGSTNPGVTKNNENERRPSEQ
ncbi:hypothetical protein ACHWQZ_G004360 [Mnemiopsis leidyi]